MKFQAIIFDFDGVLVESVAVKGLAFGALYEGEGSEFQAQVIAYHEAHGGVSRFDKIRYFEEELLGRKVSDEDVKIIASRFSDLVEERVVGCEPVSGALEFLEEFSGRLPLFVASATPTEELKRIVEKRSMAAHFKGVYGSPASKAENIAAILEAFQYDADRTLMIGDTMSDFKGASMVGVEFLGRAPPGETSPFPPGTKIIPDLTRLARALDDF